MSYLLDLSPQTDLGLPRKFQALRPAQAESIEWALQCTKPKTAMSIGTGSGKTGVAVSLANTLNVKSVYLVGSRGLQDQVGSEMAEIGMVDVRGRQNYQCAYLNKGLDKPRWSCADGMDEGCLWLQCPYSLAVEKAADSRLSLTNYSCWLKNRRYNQGFLTTPNTNLDEVGLLICDEAHSLPELIADHMSVELRHSDELLPISNWPKEGPQGEYWDSGLMPDDVWSTWAVERLSALRDEQARFIDSYPNTAVGGALARKDDRYKYLDELKTKCNQISKMDGNWVWQAGPDGIRFEPIWPGQYTGVLWAGIERVLLLSATLRPYTLSLLGLTAESYDFREWPSVFQPGRCPVYHIPTVKLTYRSGDEDYQDAINRIDEIISSRLDRKGIVHTVSYDRTRRVVEQSIFSSRMLFNKNGQEAARKARDFRNSGPGTVLVSPSYQTGWDFPGTDCEYQVVLKIPFPDTRSRVMKERCKSGNYRMYCAVQELVQICGRAMRSKDDRCETMVIDDSLTWARGGPGNPWHGFAPGYFKVHTVQKVPAPAPKL